MANACRLYLRVTWQSELVTWDGNCIAGWAYRGSRQNGSDLTYPYQPKPPDEAWKEWRYMLAATYFGGTRTDEMDSTDYPLYRQTIDYSTPPRQSNT